MLKKVTLLVAIGLSFFATNTTTAQIEEGQSLISAGIGFSSYYSSIAGFETTLPPLGASYEYMISEDFSIGGFAGLYTAEYDESLSFSYSQFGMLANYYFENDGNFNVYVGASLGYVNLSVDGDSLFGAKASGLLYGGQLGARYFLSEAFAVNAELGYGVSLLQVGVTLKL